MTRAFKDRCSSPWPMAEPQPAEVVERDAMPLTGAMLVVGFPGPGLVGSVATQYLVKHLNLTHIASIFSAAFPPSMVVRAGQAVPSFRLYAAPMACGLDGTCNQLVVLIADAPLPDDQLVTMVDGVLSWAKRRGVGEVLLLDGFYVQEDEVPDSIYGCVNDAASLGRLESHEVVPLPSGAVTGPTGAFLVRGTRHSIAVSALFGPLPAPQTADGMPSVWTMPTSARAAARLLTVLDPIIPCISLDPSPLVKEAERIESEIKENLEKQQTSLQRSSEQLSAMYG